MKKDLVIENANAAAAFASVKPCIKEAVQAIHAYGKFTTIVVEYLSKKTLYAQYSKAGKEVYKLTRAHMSVNTTTTTRRYNEALRRGIDIAREDVATMGKPNVSWSNRILEYNEKTGLIKLKVFMEHLDDVIYIDENGEVISAEAAKAMMRKESRSDSDVIHDITYTLNNIQGIQVCGRVYGQMRLKNN